jgi:Icc protein
MANLCIAHLSDLHVLRDYHGSIIEREPLCQPIPPVSYSLAALRRAVAARPDVIVLTGDLVHEGTEEDYQYLRRMIEQERAGIPVIPVLGNHDLKACFYRGYLGEERDGRYYGKYELGGYRFLFLDTATERNGCGSIPDEQVDWLEEELKTPAEQGTILLGHHPLASQQAWFHTDYSKKFCEVIQKSDVFAYLCGHAHYAETRTILGIQQITAESFAWGVETVSPTDVIYTETRGYNTCWVEGRNVIVHPHQVFPFHPEICRLSF